MSAEQMTQVAPYPDELQAIVEGCHYKGWQLNLVEMDRGQGSEGLTLVITALVKNTYRDEQIRINHLFPVPPAAYDRRSWQRWLFEQILLLERHEAAEFFVVDGERPYAPHHGPGNDPYIIFEHGTDLDVRTSFRGEVKPD